MWKWPRSFSNRISTFCATSLAQCALLGHSAKPWFIDHHLFCPASNAGLFLSHVENLFDKRAQAMDFIHEKHITGIEVGENGCQVTGLLQYRTRSLAKPYLHLMSDNVGQGCFPEPRRPEDKDMIKCLVPCQGRADEDLHLLAHG